MNTIMAFTVCAQCTPNEYESAGIVAKKEMYFLFGPPCVIVLHYFRVYLSFRESCSWRRAISLSLFVFTM